MPNLLLLISALLALALTNDSVSAQDKAFTVRGHAWGESIETVKSKEGGTALDQQMQSVKMLLFLDHEILFDEHFNVGFSFFEQQLFGITYIHPGNKRCAAISALLDQLSSELAQKYGPPQEKESRAPCAQHLKWKAGDTQIKFDADISALDEVAFSVTYRHMPTVEKVREANKAYSKGKL